MIRLVVLLVVIMFSAALSAKSAQLMRSPSIAADVQKPYVVVDSHLKPTVDSIRGKDDAPRPIAKLETKSGIAFEFVENEVCIVTRDRKQLDAFLQRWDAELVSSASTQSSSLETPPVLYVVRVNPALVNANSLNQHLAQLNTHARGEVRVSSRNAEKLLALIADETVNRDLQIGLSLGFYITAPNNELTVLGLAKLIAQPNSH